jgi:hypothetical protein
MEPLIVATYARATAAMATAGIADFFADLPKAMDKIGPGLNSLADDLFGEVVIATELRASRDRAFARQLDSLAAEVDDVRDQLAPLQQAWQIAMDNDPDSDCACIGEGCNSQGHCEQFCLGFWDCLLLILGFILIIVLL